MNHTNYNKKKSVSIIGAVLGLSCLSAWGADGQGALVQELQQRLEARDRLIVDLQQRVSRLENVVGGKESNVPVPASNSTPASPKTSKPVGDPHRVAQAPVPEKPKNTAGSFEVDEEAAEHALERTLTQTGALLLPFGRAEIQPSFTYIRQEASVPALVNVGNDYGVMSRKIHVDQFNSSIFSRFGLPLDAQLELTIPYNIIDRSVVDDYRSFGGSSSETKSSGSHLGDIQFGLAKTLVREKGWRPDMIARMTWTTPTGVGIDNGVSMGGGFHRLLGSMTMLKRQDPLAFTGRFFYEGVFDKNNDNPGDRYGFSVGTVLAASPETALSISLDQSFYNEMQLNGNKIKGSDRVVSAFVIGASSIFGRDFLLSLSGGIGLTKDSPDYFINIAMPISFDVPFI